AAIRCGRGFPAATAKPKLGKSPQKVSTTDEHGKTRRRKEAEEKGFTRVLARLFGFILLPSSFILSFPCSSVDENSIRKS
ncbi:MAG: hypothetical protein ACR2MB_09865, partial [Acidimicrobiales bacterium]